MKGTIKRLVADKSYGFVTPEGAEKDVFFHATGLNGVQFTDLNIGDNVEFEVEQSDKGPRAVQVTRV